MAKLQCYLGIALILCSGILTTSGTSSPKQIKHDYQKLRLVSAVFRHGDRTVDTSGGESYTNDPYKNYYAYPTGPGQLTNVGKRRAYTLGVKLRERYNYFLGNIYYQPNVYARSTSVVRCKMTLQLVMAGLYPPAKIEKWNSDLGSHWQPVDVLYVPNTKDGLLFPILCPAYGRAYKNMLKTQEAKNDIAYFDNLMTKMSMYTGNNITNITSLFLLYHTFATQSNLGLKLPEWSQNVFPNGGLLEAAILQYDMLSYNDELTRLNGGTLLNRMINDMNNTMNGTLSDRRINLFSAHDINVAAMLKALNLFDNTVPEFTSAVIVELLEKNDKYYVRVLRYFGIPPIFTEVRIPDCEVLCPYDKFVQLTSAITATSEDPACPLT